MDLRLIAGGGLAIGTAAAVAGAAKLFYRVIPRQDGMKVDISEMADAAQWEEYKKIITPRREELTAREHEEVSLISGDGLRLRANYFPCETPGKKVVLACHGYTSKGISDFAALSSFYLSRGYDCLIPDMRAHGESEGDYIGFGILDRFDCLDWIRWIVARCGSDVQIVLHGVSMGAATVLMVTGLAGLPENVKCITADCAFTSPYDVFAHILKRDYHLPPFPVMNITDMMCRQKAGYGFRDTSTLLAMQTNTIPILFVHGSKDNFVPTRMSYENYEACKAPKQLLIVEGAGHAASYYEDPERYEAVVDAFLSNWVK